MAYTLCIGMEDFMVLAKQPKKRVVDRLMNKSVCLFNGCKALKKPIVTESPLERDFCYHLEFDNSVSQYEPQPLGIIYWEPKSQKECQYTPDFKVHYVDGSIKYYEIKYRRDVNRSPNFSYTFELAKKEYLSQNSDLILVTDEFIHREYLFENIQLLYRSVDVLVDESFFLILKEYLSSKHSALLSDLIALGDPEFTSVSKWVQIHKMIWSEMLDVPLTNQLITVHTPVSLVRGMHD
jgi:hypothetical protein